MMIRKVMVSATAFLIAKRGGAASGSLTSGRAGKGAAGHLPILSPLGPEAKAPLHGREGFTINRAFAKTITFRIFATTMDFATNYFVLRDLATAAKLTAIGFVVGPFVYFGHEKVWEYFGSPEEPSERVSNAPAGEPKLLGAANIGHA